MIDTVIFDIDGVLCDCSQALHDFIATSPTEDRWHSEWFSGMGVYEPHPGWVKLITILRPNVYIILLTNRPESIRDVTVDWLRKHHVNYDELIMRPAGARYRDGKRTRIAELMADPNLKIVLAVDDDASQVELFKEVGISTIHAWDGLDKIHDEGSSR